MSASGGGTKQDWSIDWGQWDVPERRDWLKKTELEIKGKVLEQWPSVARELNIPKIYLDCSLAESSEVIERVKSYMSADYLRGSCLILCGPTGTGKTYGACAALREAYETFHRRQVEQQVRLSGLVGISDYYPHRSCAQAFWYFGALVGALLDRDRQQHTLRNVTRCRFLVLDDLGVEYAKEGGLVESFLDEIIYEREANRLATLVTTNLTPEQLGERLSPRIIDRLLGAWRSGSGIYVVVSSSLRRQPSLTAEPNTRTTEQAIVARPVLTAQP